MTREEAIEILEANRPDPCYQMLREAVDFAVNELKAQIDLQSACNDLATDTISRQAAIELADELKDDLPGDERMADAVMAHNEGILEYQTALSKLSSAQPERKTGNWIGTEYDGYADGNPVYYEWKCSACGCVIEDDEPTWNFCPNCGAKMEVERENRE